MGLLLWKKPALREKGHQGPSSLPESVGPRWCQLRTGPWSWPQQVGGPCSPSPQSLAPPPHPEEPFRAATRGGHTFSGGVPRPEQSGFHSLWPRPLLGSNRRKKKGLLCQEQEGPLRGAEEKGEDPQNELTLCSSCSRPASLPGGEGGQA